MACRINEGLLLWWRNGGSNNKSEIRPGLRRVTKLAKNHHGAQANVAMNLDSGGLAVSA